jgi:hypothetical protein
VRSSIFATGVGVGRSDDATGFVLVLVRRSSSEGEVTTKTCEVEIEGVVRVLRCVLEILETFWDNRRILDALDAGLGGVAGALIWGSMNG